MKALVVYESLWGNTAAIAKAIAEGIGEGAEALPTGVDATRLAAEAQLIVAGAPLLGFKLPADSIRTSIRGNPKYQSNPPDLSHPTMRSWLKELAPGRARFATFETRIWWSPGSAAKEIAKWLEAKGYERATASERFLVTGETGPLKDGELERARSWGQQLARITQ